MPPEIRETASPPSPQFIITEYMRHLATRISKRRETYFHQTKEGLLNPGTPQMPNVGAIQPQPPWLAQLGQMGYAPTSPGYVQPSQTIPGYGFPPQPQVGYGQYGQQAQASWQQGQQATYPYGAQTPHQPALQNQNISRLLISPAMTLLR